MKLFPLKILLFLIPLFATGLLFPDSSFAAISCPHYVSGIDCETDYLMGGGCVSASVAVILDSQCSGPGETLNCNYNPDIPNNPEPQCVCDEANDFEYDTDGYFGDLCRPKCPSNELYCTPTDGGTAPASCEPKTYCTVTGKGTSNLCTGACTSCTGGTETYTDGTCKTPVPVIWDGDPAVETFFGLAGTVWKKISGFWKTNDTDPTKIYYDAGNVGIGISDPDYKLMLGGSSTGADPTPLLGFGSYHDNSGEPSISHIMLWHDPINYPDSGYGLGISSSSQNYFSDRYHSFYDTQDKSAPVLQIDGNNNAVMIPNGGLCVDDDGACGSAGAGTLRAKGIFGTDASNFKVGINTASPEGRLHILNEGADSIVLEDTAWDGSRPGIRLKNNNIMFFSGDHDIDAASSATEQSFGFFSKTSWDRNLDAKLEVHGKCPGCSTANASWGKAIGLTHTGDGGDGKIYTDVGDILLEPGSGKVGIGTSSPNTRLHVNGASGENAFRVQIAGSSRLTVASNGGTSIGYYQDTPPSQGLYVYGDVGIGDSTPSYKLDVAGTIRATGDLRADDDLIVSDKVAIGTTPGATYKLEIDGGGSSYGLYIGNTGDIGIESHGSNYGVIGYGASKGVWGSSPSGYAGYFDGDVKVTGDLDVDGDITNFQLKGPYSPPDYWSSSGAGPTSYYIPVSQTNSVCFLTYVWFHDLHENDGTGVCYVYKHSTLGWKIQASGANGGDAQCEAHCLVW